MSTILFLTLPVRLQNVHHCKYYCFIFQVISKLDEKFKSKTDWSKDFTFTNTCIEQNVPNRNHIYIAHLRIPRTFCIGLDLQHITELHFPAKTKNNFCNSGSSANARVFPSITRPYSRFLGDGVSPSRGDWKSRWICSR